MYLHFVFLLFTLQCHSRLKSSALLSVVVLQSTQIRLLHMQQSDQWVHTLYMQVNIHLLLKQRIYISRHYQQHFHQWQLSKSVYFQLTVLVIGDWSHPKGMSAAAHLVKH